jgi:hypothetical protein
VQGKTIYIFMLSDALLKSKYMQCLSLNVTHGEKIYCSNPFIPNSPTLPGGERGPLPARVTSAPNAKEIYSVNIQ